VRLPVLTLATSASRTTRGPLGPARLAITSAPRSALVWIAPTVRTIRVSSPLTRRPAPSLRLPLSMAALMSPMDKCAAASAVGSGRTS
jgi:hypothetical protein